MAEKICDNCMSKIPVEAGRCSKCGIMFENTNPGGALPNGWVLAGRYTVGRYIDIDGEGVSYAAIDANTLQRVIVKEYMPVTLSSTRNELGAIVPKPGAEVLFKTTRMDFLELYRAIQRIGFAEGLVQVLDAFEDNNTAYAVQEKITGPTLKEYLERAQGAIGASRAQALMRSVLKGVETLHTENIIHRGISPENIIIESGGTAKLTGYATLALRQQGSELKPKLYEGFSAPEQYSAAEFEGKFTDIYSIGAVFYKLVTKETPATADERKIQDLLRPARALNKEVPAYLSAAISRTMRLEVSERIQTVGDLRLILSNESAMKKTNDESGLFGLTKRQTIVGLSALGLVSILLIIALIVALFSSEKPNVSSLSFDTSSISAKEQTIHDFVAKKYDEIIVYAIYLDLYEFTDPVEKYDPQVEVGAIIEQEPKAGSIYSPASGEKVKITLTVSLGKELVPMPDFISQKTMRDDAVAQLEKLEIEFKEYSKANDGNYEVGQVIETNFTSGQLIQPGKDVVELYIASKATGIPMPDVFGKTESAARAELEAKGLKPTIQYVTTEFASRVGNVVEQSPAANTTVAAGSTVVLKVANKHIMTDLSAFKDQPVNTLKAYLNERGIQYQEVAAAANDPTKAGKVEKIEQPAVNSEVTSATIIKIYVHQE